MLSNDGMRYGNYVKQLSYLLFVKMPTDRDPKMGLGSSVVQEVFAPDGGDIDAGSSRARVCG